MLAAIGPSAGKFTVMYDSSMSLKNSCISHFLSVRHFAILGPTPGISGAPHRAATGGRGGKRAAAIIRFPYELGMLAGVACGMRAAITAR